MVSLLLFHPLEPVLVAIDNKDAVSVWNWATSMRVNNFSNTNPPGSRISAISLINPHDDAMLLTATDNGVVRIWRSFMNDGERGELVTAWTALPDLVPRVGPGMVIDWQQQNGILMTTGDVGIIRVWNTERELSIQDLPTGADCCVTSIASQYGGGHILATGYGDGAIRLFDTRVPSRYSSVLSFREHNDWVVNIAMNALDDQQIISGSLSGEVKFWDARKTISFKTFNTRTPDMTAFSVHPFSPILATGSQNQKIQVLDFEGQELSLIRYHEGFLGQRIGPVSCLAFHPLKLFLAAGGTDSIAAVYTHVHNKNNF